MTFVILGVVVILGSLSTGRAAARAQRSADINAAYRQAAAGVAAEESLERKYRLQPGAAPLRAHDDAEEGVVLALSTVQRLGDRTDWALVASALAKHISYVAASRTLFEAVDRGEPAAAVNALDSAQVDPVFEAVQRQVFAAAAHHEAAASASLVALRRTESVVLAINIASLLAGVLLITSAGLALTRSRRRLRQQSDVNRHQALHDSLTGLPNRTLFQDRTTHALEAARRTRGQVAVMLLDIDRFKDVNDTLGHQYGDLLLRQLAERFEGTLRAGDSVARLGGDEFAVLLVETSLTAAAAAAKRLTEVLQKPFVVKDISLDMEASIGIAMSCDDMDVETVLRHADVAMYEAKGQHLPFMTYESTRDDNTVDRLAMLGDLRRAIGNGELLLHFQPKVRALGGDVHSVEALVRWQHPTRGLLAPDEFIPIAESTGVIHPLTTEVLRQAMTQARVWLDQGWRIPVAVNISSSSLHDIGFPAHVQSLLRTHNLPAELLSLELTESSIMTDPARALVVLEALRDMGVSLSLDDFGTGYSSMAYLKALPVRELKIDRSFVLGMATDVSNAVLVQSAVDLGHNLGLHVVAEGVEDAATQETLTGMGCDLVQGFHIRTPVPANELDEWLRAREFASHSPAGPS